MLCIQTGAKIADTNRMRFGSQQFYLKSREEMAQAFAEAPQSLANTQLVAEMCDLSIPFPKGSERYPKYPLPPEIKSDRAGYLRELCIAGLKTRYGVDYADAADKRSPTPRSAQTLVERLDFELSVIGKTGFIDYFLVVWDFIDWARRHGIPVGPGRGSGAGCLVAYVLGITNLDPLRFKLLFERFLNPERVSPPDFDIDFCMRRRGEVIDYVRQKYGNDCVANIITYGTLGAKMVIRDVSRVHDLPYAEADRLAKMIPDELNITLEDAQKKSAELRDEIAKNPVAKKIFDQALVLEGMVRNTGKHAAGIIITDRPLEEFVPLTLQEGDVTVQFDMNAVGKLGLLKMDFLGLKTLTVIADSVENIHRTADPKFDIEKIPFDDARTFALLNSGRTTGVFQLESGGMQNLCRQIGLSSIDEIVALIALYRPGPMDWIPDYIRGKKDPSTVRFPHKLLEEVCRETYGVMVYQEQVMEAAKIVAGYTLGGADMLRRAMGKKDAEAMAKERAKFVEGAKRVNNIDEKTSDAIFDILNKFAGYGFNKSHSAAYAILSYQTGFLKANYAVQFMAAMLSAELGNADKVSHFVAECEAMGLKVLGPDVNESREMFTPARSPAARSASGIRFGLAGIKGVGELAAKKIIEEREKNGPFAGFDDFASRVDPRAVNRRVFEHLAKTGAFDFSGAARKGIFDGNRRQPFPPWHRSPPATRPPASTASSTCSPGKRPPIRNGMRRAAAHRAVAPTSCAISYVTISRRPSASQFEKELLGFYVSGHPMNAYAGLADAIDTFPVGRAAACSPTGPSFPGSAASRRTIAKKLSKKDNRPWATPFTLATKSASVALNMFADGFASELQRTILAGKRRSRAGAGQCHRRQRRRAPQRQGMLPARRPGYVGGLVRKITWLLHPAHRRRLPAFLRQLLRNRSTTRAGDTRVEFAFLFDGRVAPVAEASTALGRGASPPLSFQQLRSHPAVAGVQLETKRLDAQAGPPLEQTHLNGPPACPPEPWRRWMEQTRVAVEQVAGHGCHHLNEVAYNSASHVNLCPVGRRIGRIVPCPPSFPAPNPQPSSAPNRRRTAFTSSEPAVLVTFLAPALSNSSTVSS